MKKVLDFIFYLIFKRKSLKIEGSSSNKTKKYVFYVNIIKLLLFISSSLIIFVIVLFPHIFSPTNENKVLFNKNIKENKENLLIKPQLKSFDKKGQFFQLNAISANKINDKQISLTSPNGEITLNSGEKIQVSAKTGILSNNNSELYLSDNINIYTSTNYHFILSTAKILLNKKTAESNNKVIGRNTNSKIISEGVQILENGNIKFKGKTHLTIYNAKQVKS